MKNRIKEYREARGWSQAELARKIGVQPTAISRYEKEDQRVNLPLLAKLAEAMKVTPACLISEGQVQNCRLVLFGNRQNSMYLDSGAFFDDHDAIPFAMEVEDDAMRPTANQGDIVIYDIGHSASGFRKVDGPGLWVFRNETTLYLRRVLLDPVSGGYIMTTDDPIYATHQEPRPELWAEGKVLWMIRKAY